MQEPDGNWADPKGWGHLMWGGSGFKAWAAMEHYRLTGDREFLARVYPRLAASSRWQERERSRTRMIQTGERPLTYGLMPRGMGDCGLMDDGDLYGVFLPHNIWAVYADRLALEAAEILGRTSDIDELRQIHDSGRADLLADLDRGAIREADYRWIPGVPAKTSGSRWGVLNALHPCQLLPPEHELISGTIRKIESNVSPGRLPIHTGWLAEKCGSPSRSTISRRSIWSATTGMPPPATFMPRSTTRLPWSHGARNAARNPVRRNAPAIVSTSGPRSPWSAVCAIVL
ncbi:MAG TPA: hypothetical protein VJY33_25095 [Isosphaeraceae bacterium]|nr:hypothetical protein [Isosphaeraceae bacterium]